MKVNVFYAWNGKSYKKRSVKDTWNVFGLEGHCAECVNNTSKDELPELYFSVIFRWLRLRSNLFTHFLPVLFCHSPYPITTTDTLKQPIAGAYCCVCLSTTEDSCQNVLIYAQKQVSFNLKVSDAQGLRAGGSTPHTSTFSTVSLLLLMSDACRRT